MNVVGVLGALVMFADLMHAICVHQVAKTVLQILTGHNIALVVGLVVYSLLITKATLV